MSSRYRGESHVLISAIYSINLDDKAVNANISFWKLSPLITCVALLGTNEIRWGENLCLMLSKNALKNGKNNVAITEFFHRAYRSSSLTFQRDDVGVTLISASWVLKYISENSICSEFI